MTATSVAAPRSTAQPLTIKNYLAYAAGDAANNVTFTMASMFFILYYTNVVGISGAAIGTLFLLILLHRRHHGPHHRHDEAGQAR
jgi:glucuronide carrier protein